VVTEKYSNKKSMNDVDNWHTSVTLAANVIKLRNTFLLPLPLGSGL
jgi:hypothetical protein